MKSTNFYSAIFKMKWVRQIRKYQHMLNTRRRAMFHEIKQIWTPLDWKASTFHSNGIVCNFIMLNLSRCLPSASAQLGQLRRVSCSLCSLVSGVLSPVSFIYNLISPCCYNFSFGNTELIKTWSLRSRWLQGDKQQLLPAVNSWGSWPASEDLLLL